MECFVALLFFILVLLYLPSSDSAQYYTKGEKVPLFVNKAGPYHNPKETYSYYQLPVCRPTQIVHKRMKLSEVLNGDRLAESLYNISFRVNQPRTPLCQTLLVEGDDLDALKRAIDQNYYFELVADDIPLVNFIGLLEEQKFPHIHKLFLFVHHHFVFLYNDKQIISVKLSVEKERPIRIDESKSLALTYTYSVDWIETQLKQRDASYKDEFFPKSIEIHWLSVTNSSLLVFILLAFVMTILIRIVRSDLSKYNFSVNKPADKFSDDFDDNGWKVIHGDVFRPPKHLNLLCAILGVGCQLIFITAVIIIIVICKFIDEYGHGMINATALILYAVTSGLAGYVSGRMYKQLNGQNWIANTNLAFCLFSIPVFVVWSFENSISWAYRSTQALPYQTVILLLSMWTLIGYPLTVFGAAVGKNLATVSQSPCRTRQIARELPVTVPFYQSNLVYCILGGFLPFSAISIELYYIFATVWGHEPYTLFAVLLILLTILLSVTACVSISLTYFQLSSEDYRWWWRSVFTGGSTGFFVFIYAIFFYVYRSQMNGFFQTAQFFGYVILICYGFFLTLGTVSFFASRKFIYYIYSSIKTD